MKVLLSLTIVLAISAGFVSSQVTTSEFETQIQDLRARFYGIHRTMDFYLRDSRWNVSDMLQGWNADLLTQHAILTTDVINLRDDVYEDIIERANEIGNQNECLIDLNTRLIAGAIATTNQASECAQNAYNFISDTNRDIYFHAINSIQRQSTRAQHAHFYGMGGNNVITNQQGVLDFLEILWDEVEYGWPNIWRGSVDDEENLFELYRSGGTMLSAACIDLAFTDYTNIANGIRGEIADCA